MIDGGAFFTASGSVARVKNPGNKTGGRDEKPPGWARATAIGSELAGSIAFGTLIGYWIDSKYGSAPKGVLIGSLIGIVGGFYNFIRRVYRLTQQQEQARKAHNQQSGENERQD